MMVALQPKQGLGEPPRRGQCDFPGAQPLSQAYAQRKKAHEIFDVLSAESSTTLPQCAQPRPDADRRRQNTQEVNLVQ